MARELDTRAHLHFSEDRPQVEVHRVAGNEHSVRYLPVRETLCDEIRNGALGVSETRETQRGAIRSPGSVEMHDDAHDDTAVEDPLAPQGRAAAGQENLAAVDWCAR